MFTILFAVELGFIAANATTLTFNLERRVWKVCAFVFFIIESILGITVTAWLAILMYSPDMPGTMVFSILLVLPELFSIVCVFVIIRRKVCNIEAPEPTMRAKRFRQLAKYVAFVGCALVSIVFGFLGCWDRSSLGVYMTSLVLVCSLIVFGLSVFATRRTTMRTLFPILVILFFSLFAVIRPFVRIDVFHPIVVHDSSPLSITEPLLFFQAAAGTFLVAVAVLRVPDFSIESDPEAASLDVLEIAVFGATGPLVVLSVVGSESVKLVILTILPQSMVIVGPICFACFNDLARKTQGSGSMQHSSELSSTS